MTSDRAVFENELVKDYELVTIINASIPDEKLEADIENINKFITGKGGTVSNVDRWGKRRLAYPIKHIIEGNYILTKFKMKPAFGRELEANLKISDDVLRHLLIKLDEEDPKK